MDPIGGSERSAVPTNVLQEVAQLIERFAGELQVQDFHVQLQNIERFG